MARFRSPTGVPQWATLRQAGRHELVDDLDAVIRVLASNDSQADLGVRWFLHWLVESTQAGVPSARALLVALSGSRPAHLTDGRYTQELLNAVNAWIGHVEMEGMFAPTSRTAYVRRLSAVFEMLGQKDPKRYPNFPRGLITLPNVSGDVMTLGTLGWAECDGLAGLDRDSRCLDVLKSDCFDCVAEEFALYARGQEILRGTDPSSGPKSRARALIHELLEKERHSFMKSGRSSFADSGAAGWIEDRADVFRRYSDVDLWLDAGFSADQTACLRSDAPQAAFWLQGITRLLLPCMGPTARLITALITAFACETSWNREPIVIMPRHPMVDGIEGGVGIWGDVFLKSFKARAGHEVMARIESGSALPVGRLNALWKATRAEVDQAGTGDGHAVLDERADAPGKLLRVLRKYYAMADETRALDPRNVAGQRFFFALTRERGTVVGDRFVTNWLGAERPLTRPGAGFRAIRQTVLAAKYPKVGSTIALSEDAGSSPAVLKKYYLTSPEIRAIHVRNLRFFQNAVQGVALDRVGNPVVDLVMPAEERKWFARLASLAGIASAMGVERDVPDDGAQHSTLRFSRTPENMRALYLTHLGLKRSRLVVGQARWLVQGIPLLAAVKAVGCAVVQNGLLPEYRRNARKAHRDLRAGVVVIPPILEA